MQSESVDYDLLVVGGGINGAGIARDAAGRGLRVLLCEKDDLAAHTSSASTKLIHGGLRYLEYYEFSLVRKALQEREVLLRSAPHIIWPLRFVMPHVPALRPAWLIRIGLFLYDHLSRREFLPASHGVDMRRFPAGQALVDTITRGFVYSDAWVDDARLVTLNALAAAESGATIRTRTRITGASREHGGGMPCWRVQLHDETGGDGVVRVRAVANAAGPWVGKLLKEAVTGVASQHGVRLVKGSHIVTRRLFDHHYAYIFQNPDKRIIFAIPYEQDFTLIGTTDMEFTGDASDVKIDASEIRYLCDSVNRYFKHQIGPDDVVWTYSGVRPLLQEESDNPSAVTRDYHLEMDATPGAPPLLSVFGGKITTFRKLAEQAVDKLVQALADLPSEAATGTGAVQTDAVQTGAAQTGAARAGAVLRPSTTATEPLPGGDMPDADFDAFDRAFARRHPWLPAPLAHRYCRAYGTRAERLVGDAHALADLGEAIAPGLYEAELVYLQAYEWARSAEDVLWRRSKLGLHLPHEATLRIDAWFARGLADTTPARPLPAADAPPLAHFPRTAVPRHR
ncbi:MAG: glycerol-3-phosphate dehydrogenase [Janthinobacterium lividum]